jgi:hypothetical protein
MSISASTKPVNYNSTIPKGAISDDFSPEYFFWRERGREWDALWCPKDSEMGKALNIIPHTSFNENSNSTVKLVNALLKRSDVTPKEKNNLISELSLVMDNFNNLKYIISNDDRIGAITSNSMGDRNCRINNQINMFETSLSALKKTAAQINQRFDQKVIKPKSYPRTY